MLFPIPNSSCLAHCEATFFIYAILTLVLRTSSAAIATHHYYFFCCSPLGSNFFFLLAALAKQEVPHKGRGYQPIPLWGRAKKSQTLMGGLAKKKIMVAAQLRKGRLNPPQVQISLGKRTMSEQLLTCQDREKQLQFFN